MLCDLDVQSQGHETQFSRSFSCLGQPYSHCKTIIFYAQCGGVPCNDIQLTTKIVMFDLEL